MRTLLAALALAFLAASLAFSVARQGAQSDLDTQLDQSLILTARTIESEIERFRALPDVAAEDVRIGAAIANPTDAAAIATANHYLEQITEHTGAAQLFLLDDRGEAIAASNFQTPQSLIGQNYGFRPYFRNALMTGKGRFYAIGVTTGLPGYFLSTRITAGGATGVLVVKVDLTPLQETWANAGLATAIADGDGVIFLTGEPGWLYRPLTPLAAEALARIQAARTYEGISLDAVPPILPAPGALTFREAQGNLGARMHPIAAEGWTLIAAAPLAPGQRTASVWAMGAALLAMLATGLAKIAHQRRQLVQLRLRQNALLESRVEERTRDLAREVQARRQTEAELRAAQEGLIHSEKMAALGRMSAAIVHEISQPLAAMEATLGAAEIGMNPSDSRTQTRIGTARGLVRRMQRTTKHLKTFSRKEQGELTLIDLRHTVENALELVAPRARTAGVLPQIRLPETPLMVRAGAVRVEQVLVNLLLNAFDAVANREDAQISVTALAKGAAVQIIVRDSGAGIAPDDLARVTEPFFSTKVSGEGLGLGLAISQAIVTEFGGGIEIASTLGSGTVITVSLPAANPLQEAAE
jgi:two-component system, NtrC family, C4-dicarboxylate transport sensor histidine kinase DctB